jgi:quercetin dioxygenase-like cupin family protein
MPADYQITNSVTGQVIKFIKTGQESEHFLEMESVYSVFGEESSLHYHPIQCEVFRILAGELAVSIDGDVKMYYQGEEFRIEPGTHHSMWNPGDLNTVVNWKVFPAMETEAFLNTLVRLANAGQTNSSGVPFLPIMLPLLRKYRDVIRISKPGLTVLNILYFLLYPFILLMHYRLRAKGIRVDPIFP